MSHTCAGISLGVVVVISMSLKQLVSKKTSTEVDVSGVDNFSPQILWKDYFIEP